MATAEIEKGENSTEIIGYAEPWIVAPGDSVAIKVRQTPHFITPAGSQCPLEERKTKIQYIMILINIYRFHARSQGISTEPFG